MFDENKYDEIRENNKLFSRLKEKLRRKKEIKAGYKFVKKTNSI